MIRCRSIRNSLLKRCAHQPANRRGAVILEFLLVFPIVFFATLAVFQFGLLMLTVQNATHAVIEGARTGAMLFPSATENEIADEIVVAMNRILKISGVEIGEDGTAAVLIERGASSSITVGTLPSGDVITPEGASPEVGEVRVSLCFPLVNVPTSNVGYARPVPDLLKWLGISFAGAKFQLSSRALLE